METFNQVKVHILIKIWKLPWENQKEVSNQIHNNLD